MNEDLIKNFKKATLGKSISLILIITIVVLSLQLIDETDIATPLLLIALLYFGYQYLTNKILLEIKFTDEDYQFQSYSILKGINILKINKSDVVDLKYNDGLTIKFKIDGYTESKTYGINAKPWNIIYHEIRELKNSISN